MDLFPGKGVRVMKEKGSQMDKTGTKKEVPA